VMESDTAALCWDLTTRTPQNSTSSPRTRVIDCPRASNLKRRRNDAAWTIPCQDSARVPRLPSCNQTHHTMTPPPPLMGQQRFRLSLSKTGWYFRLFPEPACVRNRRAERPSFR
jgi:hypothetical protein